MRTCLLSIKKQASPNALPRNEYKQYSHAVLVWTGTARAVHRHIQNRWASCSFHPSESEFWRFRFLGRKQKTLSINAGHFSSPHHANIHFLPDMTLFFGSFFTFTSDWCKNTILCDTPLVYKGAFRQASAFCIKTGLNWYRHEWETKDIRVYVN